MLPKFRKEERNDKKEKKEPLAFYNYPILLNAAIQNHHTCE